MEKRVIIGGLVVAAQILGIAGAVAGPWEDGMAGDAKAKATLREVSQTMTREEISQARDMARACEASNYRSCEY